jgi:hypothetical protein
MRQRNTIRLGSFLALVVLAALAVPVLADDKDKDSDKDSKDSKAKVTGTWKWEFTTQNGDKRETTAKLKQDGEKVTGTVSGRQGGNDTEIKDGKIDKDGKLTFTVEREFNGNKMTTKYNGKVEGDTIKGKTETTRGDGQSREREWEAKRAKDDDKKDGDKKEDSSK